ncbi:unnamed protein product, partial [Allacma fusca]
NELVFRDNLGGLSLLNVETLASQPFVANLEVNTEKYSISPDRKYILLARDDRPVWKYSYVAKYVIYDIQHKVQISLSPLESRDENESLIQNAVWSRKGSSLFFVHENDIYWKPEAQNSSIVRITDTGIPGVVFNGIPDFIYEEEILTSRSALWPSPSGERLLFCTFNDTGVGESVFSWYADEDQPYPHLKRLRYPKTGTANPVVTLWVTEITSDRVESIQIVPAPSVSSSEHYFSGANWFNEDTIIVTWMNRKHTVSVLTRCKFPNWDCEEIQTVKLQGSGWLDFLDLPLFSNNGSSYLIRIPWRDGEAGLFRHVVWIDVETRKEIPITHGPYEVTKILAWDQHANYM